MGETLLDISKVISSGRITIPQDYRIDKNISKGDRVYWYQTDNGNLKIEVK